MSSRGCSPDFSDGYSASRSRETHNRVTAEEDNPTNKEHDVDEKSSVDSGNQYFHQHSRILFDFPTWSVTGRRGRKAREPSVSRTGFEQVRNLKEAESKDASSTTVLSNMMRDKGKSIITTDETSEAEMGIKELEIKDESGSVGSNNKLRENINLDLCLSVATGSNVSTPYDISLISSGVGKATRRDKGKSIMDQENTVGKIKKVSEQVGDEKAHVCTFCSKSFAKHQALGGHMTSHSTRRPKVAKCGLAEGSQGCTARSDRAEGSNKLHECNVCHRVFGTGQELGGHKRAHYEGSLGTSSSKRAKYSAYGSPSSGTAVYDARHVSSSESIVDKAPVAASPSEAAETNTAAAASAGRAVLGIDLNEMPQGEE